VKTEFTELLVILCRSVATGWPGVDISTPLFPEVVSEINANLQFNLATPLILCHSLLLRVRTAIASLNVCRKLWYFSWATFFVDLEAYVVFNSCLLQDGLIGPVLFPPDSRGYDKRLKTAHNDNNTNYGDGDAARERPHFSHVFIKNARDYATAAA